jgi:cytoskeletal protein CcmA (bactofilin family)
MRKRNAADASGAATYLAPGTKIIGNLSGKGAYICCGDVEGDCDIRGTITIAEGSHWRGSIQATDIVLAGTVNGDITAKGRVDITSSAKVAGSLCASSIVVAAGAVIEGSIRIAEIPATSPVTQAAAEPGQAGLELSPAKF